MNIRIRLMNEGEAKIVNEVYNEAYGNIRPLEYFNWEFMSGPWGKAIYVVAEDLDKEGNKIIGTQCAIPIVFKNSKGEQILTAKSEDTFVNPAYRGQKLFEKMYEILFEECIKKGIQYIWGFTYARKPFIKIGFEIPFETVQAVRVNYPLKSYHYLSSLNPDNSVMDKVKILLLCLLSFFVNKRVNIFNSGSISLDTQKPESFSSVQMDVAEFWQIDQNPAYTSWRFQNNPYENNYLQFNYKNLASVIVNNRPEGFAYLEDLKFASDLGTGNSVNVLQSVLKTNSNTNKVSLYRYWGFKTNPVNAREILILKKCGFMFIPNKGTGFVWKQLNPSISMNPKDILLSRIFTQGNR